MPRVHIKKTGKINWNVLEKEKKYLKGVKDKKGTQRAIYSAEGLLGLQHGEFLRYRPRIRRFLSKL